MAYETLFPRGAMQPKSTAFASFFPPKGEDRDKPFQWIAERTSEGLHGWGFRRDIYRNKYSYSVVPKLQNYLNYTFIRLQSLEEQEPGRYFVYSEDKTSISFNSGLQDQYYTDLLLVFSRNRNLSPDEEHTQWVFQACLTPGSDGYIDTFGKNNIPEIAWYTRDSRDYVFNVNYDLEAELFGHMFERAKERSGMSMVSDEVTQHFLQGMIKGLLPRIQRDYKIAIPMYYVQERKMQLLLPFTSANGTMSALLVERDDARKIYRIKTILDEDHAFFAARLITRLDGVWLDP